MNKTIMAVLVSLPMLATALGTQAQAASVPNYPNVQCTFQKIGTNEYEISPDHHMNEWSAQVAMPYFYGMQTMLTVQDGVFRGIIGSERKIKVYNTKSHQYLSATVQIPSQTTEVISPLSNIETAAFPVTIESNQPHVFITSSGKLSSVYFATVLGSALNQEKTTFVYPVKLPPLSHTVLQALFSLIEVETPQNGYLASMSEGVNSQDQTVFKFKYRDTPTQLEYVKRDVNQILSKIIKPGMDVYTKEFTIFNWITDHVKYDYTLNAAHNSDYSALVNHVAECQGVAALTYQMMSGAGIPTRIMAGNTRDATYHFRGHLIAANWNTISPKVQEPGPDHAWDEVKLNGKWYQLDVAASLKGSGIRYGFFNLTDQQMKKTHSWNSALNWNGTGFYGNFAKANTDFVSILQHSKSKQDQALLKDLEG